MRVSRETFERIVMEAVAGIPERFRLRLQNIAILVELEPSDELLDECEIPDGETMYGYYEGTPLIERDIDGEPIIPDRIIIFQRPLEEDCETMDELREEITATIRHELAHHFGIEDDRLEELGKY